jgi:hypothetical protein
LNGFENPSIGMKIDLTHSIPYIPDLPGCPGDVPPNVLDKERTLGLYEYLNARREFSGCK